MLIVGEVGIEERDAGYITGIGELQRRVSWVRVVLLFRGLRGLRGGLRRCGGSGKARYI